MAYKIRSLKEGLEYIGSDLEYIIDDENDVGEVYLDGDLLYQADDIITEYQLDDHFRRNFIIEDHEDETFMTEFDKIDYAYSQASTIASQGYNPNSIKGWGDLNEEQQSAILTQFPEATGELPDYLNTHLNRTSFEGKPYKGLDQLNKDYMATLAKNSKNELNYFKDKKAIERLDDNDLTAIDDARGLYDDIITTMKDDVNLSSVAGMGMDDLVNFASIDGADDVQQLSSYIDEILSLKNGMFGESEYSLGYHADSGPYIDDAGNIVENYKDEASGKSKKNGGLFSRFTDEWIINNNFSEENINKGKGGLDHYLKTDMLNKSKGPKIWNQYGDPSQRANYNAAEKYITLLEQKTEDAYASNPMLKIVGATNYLSAMDTYKTNPTYYVNDVLLPVAKVLMKNLL